MPFSPVAIKTSPLNSEFDHWWDRSATLYPYPQYNSASKVPCDPATSASSIQKWEYCSVDLHNEWTDCFYPQLRTNIGNGSEPRTAPRRVAFPCRLSVMNPVILKGPNTQPPPALSHLNIFNPHLTSQSSETPGEALIKTLTPLDHSSDLYSAKSRQKRNQRIWLTCSPSCWYLLGLQLCICRLAPAALGPFLTYTAYSQWRKMTKHI